MSTVTAYRRDHETARTVGGVYVNPGHWAARQVHAFHRWTGEHELVTWCGLAVDLSNGGRQTTDTTTCAGCPEASLRAFWGRS